jgi:hypothetical protein
MQTIILKNFNISMMIKLEFIISFNFIIILCEKKLKNF